VVEDDEAFLKFVTLALARAGFQVTPMASGRELLRRLGSGVPDVLLLDRLLPDACGFALCSKVKLRYPDLPLIMFSTLGEAEDVIDALHLGADDYLPKPFPEGLLTAKIAALLRRCNPTADEAPLVCGDVVLHRRAHRVSVAGEEVHLTKTEFQLLALLMDRADRLVAHADILTHILGYGAEADEMQRNIFFHINALRKKLGQDRRHIETVRGFGYRFRTSPPTD